MNIRIIAYFMASLILVLLIAIGVIAIQPVVCNPIAGAASQMVSVENGLEFQEMTYICD